MILFLSGVIAFLLACAGLTTAFLFRAADARQTIPRFILSALASIATGGAMASLAVALLTGTSCANSEPCEYGGFMEGGLVIAALWLALYSLSYVLVGYLIAVLVRAVDSSRSGHGG